jgi:outer membrane protein OmpA-like peptidoglycan-associated protein
LDSVWGKMNENPTLKAFLIAYTDSVGTENNNLKLSKNRVEEMRGYLLSKNIENERIICQFKGELYESEDNLALNRKGRIVLLGENLPKEQAKQAEKPHIIRLKGKITDIKDKNSIANALIEVSTNKDKKQVFSAENGEYELEIEGDSFSVSVNVNCYFFVFKTFNQIVEKDLDIPLEKMRKGSKLPLKDIVFVGDKAVFLPEAMPELMRLLNLMTENANLKVEIGGHINGAGVIPFKYQFYTDPDSLKPPEFGDIEYDSQKNFFTNEKTPEEKFFLSLNRARAVRDFLRNRGIDNSRISYRGYSGTQMKYPNPRNPDQEKMNRRVEITVTESECQ